MGVQQHRRSRSRNNARRAEILRMTAPNLVICSKCREYKLPHRACPACGYYNDKVTVPVRKAD